MHQEYSSDGSLSLAITLFRTMQTISLQYAEKVLLTVQIHKMYFFFNTALGIVTDPHMVALTHDLLLLQTSHGRGTVDGGLSR